MLTLATERDLPQAVALINASYRGDSARQGWAHEADYIDGERTTLETLRDDLARDPSAGLYILREPADAALQGCVWIELHNGHVYYIGLLTVRPDLQDRHLGRALLSEAEALVKAKGGVGVRLTVVHLRDTLIAWYQRRGYQLTGETSPFPAVDPPRDDLHFVVLSKWF